VSNERKKKRGCPKFATGIDITIKKEWPFYDLY